MNGSAPPPQGPDPSTIHVARPYYFEQIVQDKMRTIGSTEAKEDAIRIQGVTWIDNVRKHLQLPVRTYNTACVYYHKFRLEHPDNEYHYYDAAAAALFNACKIEDTLKKSRDILCAAWNMRVAPSEHLSSDDPAFENHAKTIVGLERLMLEASGFDFRNRYPQRMLLKFVKSCNLGKDTVGVLSYRVLLDLYRTFAPLKQTSQTMAMASLELAIRLQGIDLDTVKSDHAFDYIKWSTTREEIMETLADLLDLYTTHRSQTVVGPDYAVEKFLSIRITLNQESQANGYPRYTEWTDINDDDDSKDKLDSTKTSPKDLHLNGSTSISKSVSPHSPAAGPGTVGERGKEGTLRFMLDPERARDEKNVVNEFFRTEEIEEEVEIEVYVDPYTNEIVPSPPPLPPPRQDVSMSMSSTMTSSQPSPSNVGMKPPPKALNKLNDHKRKIQVLKDSRSGESKKFTNHSNRKRLQASPPPPTWMNKKPPGHLPKSRTMLDANNPNHAPLGSDHRTSSPHLPYRQPPQRSEGLPSDLDFHPLNQHHLQYSQATDTYLDNGINRYDEFYRPAHDSRGDYNGPDYLHPDAYPYQESHRHGDYYGTDPYRPYRHDGQAFPDEGWHIRGSARSEGRGRYNDRTASVSASGESGHGMRGAKHNGRGRGGATRGRAQKRSRQRATKRETGSEEKEQDR